MNIRTYLDAETKKLFEEQMESTGLSKYALAKKLISQQLNQRLERPEQLEHSGDVLADAHALAESDITTADIEKAIASLDRQSKTKNSIKKTGAFHEENAVLDIKSMVMSGKPSFYELKYHFDWWYYMSILVNAVAMRGVHLKPKVKSYLQAINTIPDPYKSHSTYEDDLIDKKARKWNADF